MVEVDKYNSKIALENKCSTSILYSKSFPDHELSIMFYVREGFKNSSSAK